MLDNFYSNNPKYVFHTKITDYNEIKSLLTTVNDIIILPKKMYYNHNYRNPVFVFDIVNCYDEDYNNFDKIILAILDYENDKLNLLQDNKNKEKLLLNLKIYDVLDNHENTLNMIILFCCARNKLNLLKLATKNPLFCKLPVSYFALYFLIAIIYNNISIMIFIAQFIKKEIAIRQIINYMVDDCYKICDIDKHIMLYTISSMLLLIENRDREIQVIHPQILISLSKVSIVIPTLRNSSMFVQYCFDFYKIALIKYILCEYLPFDIYLNEILFFYFMIS